MDAASDEELLGRYFRDENSVSGRAALDELFGSYHNLVALWCLRLSGDRAQAYDLAQEVFMKAYAGLRSYRGGAKFSTWLYAIARNHCFNAIQARAVRPSGTAEPELLEMLADPAENPEEQLEKRSEYATAIELLSSLDEDEKKVMVLHYQEGLPLDAVTRLLQLKNASGAKALVVSARRKLKSAWDRRKRWRGPISAAGG